MCEPRGLPSKSKCFFQNTVSAAKYYGRWRATQLASRYLWSHIRIGAWTSVVYRRECGKVAPAVIFVAQAKSDNQMNLEFFRPGRDIVPISLRANCRSAQCHWHCADLHHCLGIAKAVVPMRSRPSGRHLSNLRSDLPRESCQVKTHKACDMLLRWCGSSDTRCPLFFLIKA